MKFVKKYTLQVMNYVKKSMMIHHNVALKAVGLFHINLN